VTAEAKKALAVLLIEDNGADAFLTKEILHDSTVPVTVHVVQDAAKAFAHMLSGGVMTPDLILIDLNPLEMDGFTFLTEMAKEERLKYIPVFILSASSERADIEKAMYLGARGYFTKPLDPDRFEMEMQKLLKPAEQN